MARYLKLKSWRGPACYLLPFFILLSIILVLLKNNEELRTQLDSCNCTPCAHAVLAATKSDWLKEEDTYFYDGYFRFLEGVTNNPAHWNHLLAAYQPHVKETDVALDFGAGGGFALHRVVCAHLDVDIAAAHAGDGGVKFTALAVEQRDHITRLQAQHLHMTRRASGQAERQACGQGGGAVKARHVHMRP